MCRTNATIARVKIVDAGRNIIICQLRLRSNYCQLEIHLNRNPAVCYPEVRTKERRSKESREGENNKMKRINRITERRLYLATDSEI